MLADRETREKMTEILRMIVERSVAATPAAAKALASRPQSFQAAYNAATYAALADEAAKWTADERTLMIAWVEDTRYQTRGGMRAQVPSFRVTPEDRDQIEKWADEMGGTMADYMRESALVYAITPDMRRRLYEHAKETNQDVTLVLKKIIEDGLRYL